MVIKKWNGSAWQAQATETTLRGIKVDTAGLGSTTEAKYAFTTGGKLKEEHFPDYIFGGLKFQSASTIPSSSSFATTLIGLINTAINEGGDAESIVGSYYIATASGNWPIFSGTNGGSGVVYVATSAENPNEEGQTTVLSVEAGDWIVVSRLASGDGQAANSAYTYKLSVINQTYRDAGTSQKGIVQLSSQSTYASLSGNNVVTDGVLKTVIDNAGFITSAQDSDTTYTINTVGSGSNAIIRLTGSDSSTDDVTLAAGSNVTISESGDTITIAAADTNTFRTVTAGGNTLGSTETLAFTAGSNVTITESGGAVTIAATDTNTDTRRAIEMNGSQILSAASTTPLDLIAGSNITLSNSGGNITIASTDTNTDTRRAIEVNGTQRLSSGSVTALDLQATALKGVTLGGSSGDVSMELTYKVYHGNTLPTLTNDATYNDAIGFEW
jgi:hypothetical protein